MDLVASAPSDNSNASAGNCDLDIGTSRHVNDTLRPGVDLASQRIAAVIKINGGDVGVRQLGPDVGTAIVAAFGPKAPAVDFTNPMLPPGMNAQRIHAGITLALKQMAERGWHADLCLLRPDETAGPDVERRLKAQTVAAKLAQPDVNRALGPARRSTPLGCKRPWRFGGQDRITSTA